MVSGTIELQTENSLPKRLAGLTEAYGFGEGLVKALKECSLRESREFRMKLMARHTGWLCLLDPFHRDKVLVVDPEAGTVPIVLSRFYKQVYLWSEDESAWSYQKKRIEWLGIENIQRLPKEFPFPLADHSCDAAALYPEPNSKCLDTSFLQETNRVLRPTGSCYIGFENHYDHRHFISKVGGKAGSDRSDRDSLWSIRRKLRTYFRSIRFYPLKESRYDLQEILPPDEKDPLWERSFSSVGSWVKEKARHYLGSTYGIVAGNNSGSSSLIEAVLVEVASRLGRNRTLTLRRLLIGKPAALLLFAGQKGRPEELLIRIPLDDFTLLRLQREYGILKNLIQLGSVAEKTPRPMMSGEVAGFSFFVEELLDGITPQKPSELTTREAVAFLGDFHSKTAIPTVMDKVLLTNLIHYPFALALPWIPEEDRCDFIKVEENIAASLRGRTIPLVWSHGDFTFDNLLVDKETGFLTGIVDWDYSKRHDLPLIDLLYFLHYDEKERNGESLAEAVCRRLLPAHYRPFEKEVIDFYCWKIGLSSDLLQVFTILSWVYHLAYRFEDLRDYPFPDLMEECASNVVREIKKECAG